MSFHITQPGKPSPPDRRGLMRQKSRNSQCHSYPKGRQVHWARWAFVVLVASACGSVDDKFAAETSDEYTEPLGEVTIGEPGGRVFTLSTAGAALAADDGGAPPPRADSGAGTFEGGLFDASRDAFGGSAGSVGAGGAAGFAGSFGSGGSFGGSAGVGGSVGGTGGFAGNFGTGGAAGKGGGFDGGVGPSGPS